MTPPQPPRRKRLRLRGFDYSSSGAYFVTICTNGRLPLLGEVENEEMRLSECGEIAHSCWLDLPLHYAHLDLDSFVIMPNHLHGILILREDGADLRSAPTRRTAGQGLVGVDPRSTPRTPRQHGIPQIIRSFKSFSTRRINEHRNTPGALFWQRSYYEHVIRDEPVLSRIRHYILANPADWSLDRENPDRRASDEFDRWLQGQGARPRPGGGRQ